MSVDINALIIFCEGPHDSAYVRMVLKKVMGFSAVSLKFSEMPSPFHKLFETAVTTHAAQDMSLDMAHKFFLPDTVLRKGNDFIFLFNSGGKAQYDKVGGLLTSYIPVLGEAETLAHGTNETTQSVQYLFLYDADADGLEATIGSLKLSLGTINGEVFIDDNWLSSTSDFGKISNDKAVFVWGNKPEQGTLEDILYPIFEFDGKNKDLINKASDTITDCFDWEIEHCDLVKSIAENGKLKKAVLTTVGQRKKPGSSFNVILEQSGFVSQEALNSSKITAEFVGFLNEFLRTNKSKGPE